MRRSAGSLQHEPVATDPLNISSRADLERLLLPEPKSLVLEEDFRTLGDYGIVTDTTLQLLATPDDVLLGEEERAVKWRAVRDERNREQRELERQRELRERDRRERQNLRERFLSCDAADCLIDGPAFCFHGVLAFTGPLYGYLQRRMGD